MVRAARWQRRTRFQKQKKSNGMRGTGRERNRRKKEVKKTRSVYIKKYKI